MSDFRPEEASAAGGLEMPKRVRAALYLLIGLLGAGGLYLVAVRGDVLLADLSALAALICG